MTSIVSVAVAPSGGRLDVHPQPVDLPAGRGEVTLQLQLSLPQSANIQNTIECKFWNRIRSYKNAALSDNNASFSGKIHVNKNFLSLFSSNWPLFLEA